MSSFNEAHPEIDLRLSTTYRSVDFRTEDFDAAIRYGEGAWDDLTSEFLFAEGVTPVCSPALIAKLGRPIRPDDLAASTLLHSANTPDYWRLWLGTVGATNIDPDSGRRFDNCLMALEAAGNGLGFALVNPAYLERDISIGRLVAPFSEELTRNTGWYFVYPPRAEDLNKIAVFRDWLFRELAAGVNSTDDTRLARR